MGRVLALDLGEQRTGVAITDPSRTFALPHDILYGDPVPAVQELILTHDVDCVVVGEPLGMSGRATPQTNRAYHTIERLQAALEIPVIPFDERLTSVQAEQERRRAGVRRAARKTPVDAEAAALLLAAYLATMEPRA